MFVQKVSTLLSRVIKVRVGEPEQRLPLMVTDVSAIFVAKTIFRLPAGGGLKTICCCSGGSCPCNAKTKALSSVTLLLNFATALSISLEPVRKTRMSPSASLRWISIAFLQANSMYAKDVAGVSKLQCTSTGNVLPGMKRVVEHNGVRISDL